MTSPVDGPADNDPAQAGELEAVDAPADPAADALIAAELPGEAPETTQPVLRTTSLEGRRAPGLYVVGWLATLLGGPVLVVAITSTSGGFGRLLLVALGGLLFGLGLTVAAGAQAIERRDRVDLAYRGPSPFLVFAATIPLTILLELPFVLVGFDVRSPAGTLLGVGLSAAIYVLLLGLTVVGTGALGWPEIAVGIVASPARRIVGDLLVGVLAAVPVLLATLIVAAILVGFTGVTPEGPIPTPTDASGFVVLLLAAAIVAPVSEELFYRGFATTAWLRSYGARRGIVQGALFFAFVHIVNLSGADFDHAGRAALVAFGSRIPVALALGWIFVARRSLAASLGLHATFNGILVVVAALSAGSGRG